MAQPTLADFLALVGEINQKVLDLQAKQAAGGLTAAEEQQLNDALMALSKTADPTVPNP